MDLMDNAMIGFYECGLAPNTKLLQQRGCLYVRGSR